MSRFSTAEIPENPGVYVFYGGGEALWVGFGTNVRERVEHHLLQGEPMSSPGLEVAASLNPARVTKVCWWNYPSDLDAAGLPAAWELAVRALSPSLRPRFSLSDESEKFLEDLDFVHAVRAAVEGEPHGVFIPQNLDTLTRTVLELEGKVASLQARLDRLHGKPED